MARRAKDVGLKELNVHPLMDLVKKITKIMNFSKGIDNVSIISKKLSGEVEALVDCHSKFDLEGSLKVEKNYFL